MYKEIIISIIVIALILTFNVITQNYTTESVNNIDSLLVNLREDVIVKKNKDKDEEIMKKVQNILEKWKERYEKLTFYIEHDELEKVETELTMLNAYLEMGEYEQAIGNLDNSVFILNHIKDKFTLQVKNIF